MERTKALEALKRAIDIIEKMDGQPLQAIAVVAPPNGSVVEMVVFGSDGDGSDFASSLAHNLGRAMAEGGQQSGSFVGLPRR